MKSNVDTVSQYIESMNFWQRAVFMRIRSLILEKIPQENESMQFGYVYYKSGGHADMGIGAHENYIGFYVHPEIAKCYEKAFHDISETGGCIRIRKESDVKPDVIRKIVSDSINFKSE